MIFLENPKCYKFEILKSKPQFYQPFFLPFLLFLSLSLFFLLSPSTYMHTTLPPSPVDPSRLLHRRQELTSILLKPIPADSSPPFSQQFGSALPSPRAPNQLLYSLFGQTKNQPQNVTMQAHFDEPHLLRVKMIFSNI